MRCLIDCGLGVVTVIKATTGALRDARLGVGKAVLGFRNRNPKITLVRFAALVFGLTFVVQATSTLRIALTLALLKAGFGCFNRSKPGLPAFKFSEDVQAGFVLLGLVGVGRFLQ